MPSQLLVLKNLKTTRNDRSNIHEHDSRHSRIGPYDSMILQEKLSKLVVFPIVFGHRPPSQAPPEAAKGGAQRSLFVWRSPAGEPGGMDGDAWRAVGESRDF